jgi:hypothetical protein
VSIPQVKENEDGTVEYTVEDESNVVVDDKDKGGANKEGVSNDTDIEIVDDTPEKDRGRKPMTAPPEEPSEEELKTYSQDAQKRIKHFTKGYHEERRAKESAQRERDEAARIAQAVFEENKRLKSTLAEGHTALVNQTEVSVKADVEAAKQQLRAAHESFDAEQIADAQEKLTEAKIKLSELQKYKTAPVQKPQDQVQTRQPTQSQQQAPAADQKALAWNQRNQWFGKDPEMTSYVLGLHKKLVAEGVDTRSDDYYERIDARVRKLFPENFDEDTEQNAPVRRKGSPVAPATRSTAPKKIVLTATQVQLARRLGVPLEEYAKQIAKEQGNV